MKNAFESVVPRGPEIPYTEPVRRKRAGRALTEAAPGERVLRAQNGARMVTLARRPSGLVIGGAAAGEASRHKRAALSGGGIR